MNLLNQFKSAVTMVAVGMSFMASPTVFSAGFPAAGNVQAGAQVWAENCGRCHNYRSGSELRDDQWVTTSFHMRVRAGLTGQETRDVLSFLQSSNANYVVDEPVNIAAKTKTASENYAQTCAACHGVDGKGNLPGMPNFTSATGPLLKSDQTLLTSMTEGVQSPGSALVMPAKGGNPSLQKADLEALLAYIRKLFSK